MERLPTVRTGSPALRCGVSDEVESGSTGQRRDKCILANLFLERRSFLLLSRIHSRELHHLHWLERKTSTSPSLCAYHNPILNLRPPVEQPRRSGTMDSFLLEGPADQSAIFNRPDNGMLSISKGCTCLKNGEKRAGRL